jgi:hypothetical protein
MADLSLALHVVLVISTDSCHMGLLTSILFISWPKSGRTVYELLLDEVFPVPDPLDGPGGEGGIGGAGTRLILELTTDWAVEILLGGAVGPRIGVCDVRAVLYDLNIS